MIFNFNTSKWDDTKSWEELVFLNKLFLKHGQGIFTTTPWSVGPDTDSIVHLEPLLRLHEYGILTADNRAAEVRVCRGEEWIQGRYLPVVEFLVKDEREVTTQFFERLLCDDRLALEILDSRTGLPQFNTKHGTYPLSIGRTAETLSGLAKEQWEIEAGRSGGPITLGDFCLEDAKAVKDMSVYICLLRVKVSTDFFYTATDEEFLAELEKIDILEEIAKSALASGVGRTPSGVIKEGSDFRRLWLGRGIMAIRKTTAVDALGHLFRDPRAKQFDR
ncbi:hypothetical protein EDB80DRAFT_693375 [Ilyonectria destructans]|nr:hypothetical protein EDB80DRAFT_693375 [Ilyonectria destructans]